MAATRRIAAVLLAGLVAAAVGCSHGDAAGTGDAAGGRLTPAPQVPRLAVHPHADSPAALVHGTLLARDCVVVRKGGQDFVAIFPDRAELTADGVVLDGEHLRFGSAVRLAGGETTDADQLGRFGAGECGLGAGVFVGGVAEPSP